MKNLTKFAFVMLIVWLMAACEKQQVTNNTPITGSFILEFEHVWGMDETPFLLNQTYVQPMSADTITVNSLKYYISNISLTKTDGTVWKETNSYHLVSPEENELKIANIPSGDYIKINFTIGIDSARNCSGLQDGALDPSNGLFWDWTSGYQFIQLEGKSPQAPNQTISYHIGGYKTPFNAINSKEFSFGADVMGISPTTNPQIHLMMNVSKIWHGPTLVKNLNDIQKAGTDAVKMAQCFADGISFDHLHP